MTETTKMIKAIANDSKVRIDRIVANYEQLEKENAELKEQLRLAKEMPYSAVKEFAEEKTQDQLTKAKVFIRSLKSLIEDVCDINYLSKDNTRLLVEAEQFLSEVEK